MSVQNLTAPIQESYAPNDRQKDTDFSFFLTYSQFIYMSLLTGTALIFAIRFYSISRNGRGRLSTQLRIHLLSWSFFMFISLIYALTVLIYAILPGHEYNFMWLVLTGCGIFSSVHSAPLSTCFIALDRIVTLSFPGLIKSPHRFHAQILSLFLIGACFASIFLISFIRVYYNNDRKTTTTCLTFGCLMIKGQLNDLLTFKMCLGWLNIILGLGFIFLYLQYGRNLVVKREKKKNVLVLLILLNELIFNVIPTTFYIFFYSTIIANATSVLSGTLGAIVTPSAITDGFITIMVYYRTWTERFPTRKNQKVNIITPAAAQSSIPTRSAYNLTRHSQC